MPIVNTYPKLDSLIGNLSNETDLDVSVNLAIEVANEIMGIIMPNTEQGDIWRSTLKTGDSALNQVIPVSSFPNSKVQTWFEKHVYLGGERLALNHFSHSDAAFESRFYWLNRSASKARVTAGVMLTSNWEDSALTRHPNYKVGIDFFLTADTNALLMAISENGNLRVLELAGKLSNTQIDILNLIDGVGGLIAPGEEAPQQLIHQALWNAFAVREVNRRFYDGISTHFNELVQHLISVSGGRRDEPDAKLFANRLIGRLLFIWFLRKKGFIDESIGYFDHLDVDSVHFYENNLKKLFFATLNTPIEDRGFVNDRLDIKTPYLNGGLFEPLANDWFSEQVSFPKAWFVSLFSHFDMFNFTTDESTPEYEQVAIDPEMLGRVFENLLASQLTETGEEARKASGSFYTPREIVAYMCKETLRHYLYAALDNVALYDGVDSLLDMNDAEFETKHSDAKKSLWGKNQVATIVPKVLNALDSFTVLDPACGSGAYPMGMLQLLLKTKERLQTINDRYAAKLDILCNSLFGVDIQPMATEISRLRAWLSLIVDVPNVNSVKPLPNLDFMFICANSLVPLPENTQLDYSGNELTEERIKELKTAYFKETKPSEKEMKRNTYFFLTRGEADLKEKFGSEFVDEFAKQNNFVLDRTNDTKRFTEFIKWDPFDIMSSSPWFDAKAMFGVSHGFDAVIGNPPYIHLESIKELSKNLYKPIGYKTYEARGDMYTLFYERGMQLLKEGGILCYITSNKWMRAAYGQSLRDYFVENANPVRLIDFAGQKVFDATVDTNILMVKKEPYAQATEAVVIKEDYTQNLSDYIKQSSVRSNFVKGRSWTILSDIEQRIKEKIEAVGVPLREWDVKISRGILTGCNDAFIIDGATKDRLIAEDPKSAEIIRPILRGRDIKRYGYEFADKWLIATFPSLHYDIDDYPAVKQWLLSADWSNDIPAGYGQLKLEQTGATHLVDGVKFTARKKTGNKWYETQDQIGYWEDFYKHKVVYPNMTKFMPFYLDTEGFFTNQKCFVITGSHIEYLCAFLNSSLFKYCYKDSFPELLGETRELSKVFFDEIKVVEITSEMNSRFTQIVGRIQTEKQLGNNTETLEREIDNEIFQLYGLSEYESNAVGFIEIK